MEDGYLVIYIGDHWGQLCRLKLPTLFSKEVPHMGYRWKAYSYSLQSITLIIFNIYFCIKKL